MKNKIHFYSTDKVYQMTKQSKWLKNQVMHWIFLLSAILLLVSGLYFSIISFQQNGKNAVVNYNEKGKADYTVYLKNNNFYDSKYLHSGMQYVASLINTINTNFNYEIHSTKNLKFDYQYKIVGSLQIRDQLDTDKVLYKKDKTLLQQVKKSTESNNIVINEDLDIDYDEYNNYVNSYKREYGLSVNSQLVLTMDIKVLGKHSAQVEQLNRDNQIQITIPLSEQTLDISIDTDNIDHSDSLNALSWFSIKSISTLVVGFILLVIGLLLIIIDRKIYLIYKKDNIYTLTVRKILNEYDSLIVNGNVTINENKYPNKVYPEQFSEMVDASINLQSPILYYEVIPGEKCFFVIVKDDTIYKYRLTKAYLEKTQMASNDIEKEDSMETV